MWRQTPYNSVIFSCNIHPNNSIRGHYSAAAYWFRANAWNRHSSGAAPTLLHLMQNREWRREKNIAITKV